MALSSMTGFARQAGQSGAWTWAWEVKTVNAKGFDLRLRLPPGFDALEPAVRADVPKRLARGTCFASLSAQRAGAGDVRINRPALDALVAALADIAVNADIREELDRLATHIASCRELLAKGGAVGRRLDFLAQELSRESNTLSAKSPDAELTAVGLELKVQVEQFREQVQNLE